MIEQYAVILFFIYCWYLCVKYDTWGMDEEERPLISSGLSELTPINRQLIEIIKRQL